MIRSYPMTLAAAAAILIATVALAAEAPRKTPELVAKGKESYQANCASCHGDAGMGDGVAAAALTPKPRNLVKEPFRNGTSATQVFSTIEKGIDGTTMAAFGYLPAEERWALTYYVLDLRGAKTARK